MCRGGNKILSWTVKKGKSKIQNSRELTSSIYLKAILSSGQLTWDDFWWDNEGNPGYDDEEASGEVDLDGSVQLLQRCWPGSYLQQHRGPPSLQVNLQGKNVKCTSRY